MMLDALRRRYCVDGTLRPNAAEEFLDDMAKLFSMIREKCDPYIGLAKSRPINHVEKRASTLQGQSPRCVNQAKKAQLYEEEAPSRLPSLITARLRPTAHSLRKFDHTTGVILVLDRYPHSIPFPRESLIRSTDHDISLAAGSWICHALRPPR